MLPGSTGAQQMRLVRQDGAGGFRMKVVLLAGGQGTRLGEVTRGVRPKPLVEVAGKPILWHVMKMYARFGHTDFIICAGFLGEMISEYFANYRLHSSDFRVNTATGEIEVLEGELEAWSVLVAHTGKDTMTAGRIARASKYLGEEPFFLTYGDGVSDIDIASLLDYHESHGRLATITGVAPPGRFGELDLQGDRIAAMSEKPDHTDRYINGGFMVLERAFVERYCKIEGADDIMLERAPLENAALDGQLMMYRHEGFWQCMDTMRDWELLNRLAEQDPAPWE